VQEKRATMTDSNVGQLEGEIEKKVTKEADVLEDHAPTVPYPHNCLGQVFV